MKSLSLMAVVPALACVSPCTAAQPGPRGSPAPATFVAPAPIRDIVDRELGTRHDASDREAVARCATAALAQGAILYGVNGYSGTDGYAGYVGAYRPGTAGVPGFPGVPANMRVSSITDVQRRADGMRVKGLIDSGVVYRGDDDSHDYQGPGSGGEAFATAHPSNNDLAFRCNLDNAGLISSMHVERHTTTYRRY
jgi:hypothetical protein